MSKKIKVTVEVEPGQEVTIKPLGETLAETSDAIKEASDKSVTGTTSNTPYGPDVDGDVDF